MISQRNHGLFSMVAVGQILLAGILFWGMLLIFGKYYRSPAQPERYVIYFALLLMALAIEAMYRYKADNLLQKDTSQKHHTALVQSLAATATILAFLVAARDQTISRVFLFSFTFALYGLMFVSSCLLPPWVARFTFSGVNRENTLLVGPLEKADGLRSWLQHKAELGIHTVGLLCDDAAAKTIKGVPVLGTMEDFDKVVKEHQVSQVILVELPMLFNALSKLASTCEHLGVRLLVANDLDEKIRHSLIHFEDDGLHFFGLRNEPLQNPLNRALKRVVDIAVALPIVLVVLPVLTLIVFFFQRWQSPGPVFYSQYRAGLQNQRFRIWKFRTMHVNNPSVSRQASEHDDRIYPAGRWFRKLSIDEFPQFLNVLRGEMSVVGPRPHLIEHNEQFAQRLNNYYVRKFVKPGITGLAQINGYRGETKEPQDLENRIKYDIEYLENWSLSAEVAIIARTAGQILFPPRSAY